jgi:hypothetical protein
MPHGAPAKKGRGRAAGPTFVWDDRRQRSYRLFRLDESATGLEQNPELQAIIQSCG